MRPFRVIIAGALLASVGIPVLAAEQQVTCGYDEPSKTVTVSAPDHGFAFVVLSVEAGAIMWEGHLAVPRSGQKQPCGTATTANTDLIRAQGGSPADFGFFLGFDERGGPFAPGATAEASGISEIEIEFLSRGFLVFGGSTASSVIRLGSLGANINGDDDVDVTLAAPEAAFGYVGGPGPDDIAATGGLGTGDPSSRDFAAGGGDGSDLLVAGPGRSSMDGGGGEDVLSGATARDALSGGAGNDRLTGLTGADDLEGEGGNDELLGGGGRDRLNGGRGRDRCLGGPGKDAVENCDR
jgi:Ca2+-binding RTX toxin-like protein